MKSTPWTAKRFGVLQDHLIQAMWDLWKHRNNYQVPASQEEIKKKKESYHLTCSISNQKHKKESYKNSVEWWLVT